MYKDVINSVKKTILDIENKSRRTDLESQFILLDFTELKELKNKNEREVKDILDYKKKLKTINRPSKECKLELYNSGIYKKGSSFNEIYYNENIKNLNSCHSYNFKILRDFDQEELQQILDLNLIDKIFSNKSQNKNTPYDKKLSILCLYLIKYFNLYSKEDNIDTFIKKIKEFKDKNIIFGDKKNQLLKKARLISCLEELDYPKMKNMSPEDLDKLLSFDNNINDTARKILTRSISGILTSAILYKKYNSSKKEKEKEKIKVKTPVKSKQTLKKKQKKKD